MASGSRSTASPSAPSSRNGAAWPPPPTVASTTRQPPVVHSRTASARTGTWYVEVKALPKKTKAPPAVAGGAGGVVPRGGFTGGRGGSEPRTPGWENPDLTTSPFTPCGRGGANQPGPKCIISPGH